MYVWGETGADAGSGVCVLQTALISALDDRLREIEAEHLECEPRFHDTMMEKVSASAVLWMF
jgi:hypothetical protein